MAETPALIEYCNRARGPAPTRVLVLFGADVSGRGFAGARMQLRFPDWSGDIGLEQEFGVAGKVSSTSPTKRPKKHTPPAVGGKKEAVREISASSRRMLRESIWAVQPSLMPQNDGGTWCAPASLMTLTYPEEDFPRHFAAPRLHKDHLRAFRRALLRNYLGTWALWIIEHQRNGNIHFHLLVHWGDVPSDFHACRRWVAETWSRIAAIGRENDEDGEIRAKNCRVGTSVEPIYHGKTLAEYCSKAGPVGVDSVGVAVAAEMAKRSQKTVVIPGQGRWWGIINKAGFRAAKSVIEIDLPEDMGRRLWQYVEDDWRRFYEQKGIKADYLPRWMNERHFRRILRRTKLADKLWALPAVDVSTGEVLAAGKARAG